MINRFRLHQQVVYESDVFEADGRKLDVRYWHRRRNSEQWSDWRFPKEKPPISHINLWRKALTQLAPRGRRATPLGQFSSKTNHKHWVWSYCPQTEELRQQTGDRTIFRVYTASAGRERHRLFLETAVTAHSPGQHICTVIPAGDNRWRLSSHCKDGVCHDSPRSFLEVLHEWGHTWIWENMVATNGSGRGLDISLDDEGEWV